MDARPGRARLVGVCLFWYLASVVSNSTAKTILETARYPVSLTYVQFSIVAACSLLWQTARRRGTLAALAPSRTLVLTTVPMSIFQLAGHILSSHATSRVPVSVVHTVKALSPLFTVCVYRYLFRVRYPAATYTALVPLTLGVMMTCSLQPAHGGNMLGIGCALGSTVVFVSQNIFTKRLVFLDDNATGLDRSGAHRLAAWLAMSERKIRKQDKVTILLYASSMAFVLMTPVWLVGEGHRLVYSHFLAVPLGAIAPLVVLNGVAHFFQSIMAFSVLSMASPVAYSVAGLVKRIFVIVLSIIWFRQPTAPIQAVGILLTFCGLYMYDQAAGRTTAPPASLSSEAET